MKKSTILITLVSFLFMGISSIAQISEHKKLRDNLKPTKRTSPQTIDKKSLLQNFKSSDGQVSRPGNSEDYYWESGSNTWFHATNTEYSYNESGQILERLTTEANSGTNLWKDVYTYDSHGEMTENTSYIWNGTEWEISYGNKYNITYDNNGNITENEYQWWDYQTNSWQNEWKDISVYDNNGYITEMIYQNWENEAWLNNWKDVLTLNASGIPTELMNYEWDGNDWVASEKYTDIVWHSWLGWDENGSQPSSYTNQTYENGQWVNYERYNAIYTGNNYIGTYEVWENGAWMNSDRETVIRSATERSELYEYWDNGAMGF